MMRVLLVAWVQLYMLGPELMKLPMLFAHFQEHRAEDGPLSFSAFLDLHYSNSGHEESDHKGHEDLPFHHHHGSAMDNCVCKVWMSDAAPAVSFPELMGGQDLGHAVDDAELSGHAQALFQPPRPLA